MAAKGEEPLIRKRILFAGRQSVAEFLPGSKVQFHFTTKIVGEDGVVGDVIDDSRKHPQPMELLLGKQFKLEVWESIVRTMAVGEVAEFHVHSSLCLAYPVVAKTLRDVTAKAAGHHNNGGSGGGSHCCGGMALAGGGGPQTGYADLNQLMERPRDLVFTLELLGHDPPLSYAKEPWQMDETEKLQALPRLKERGNQLYKEGKTTEASEAYSQALGILEQLILKEKPGDDEWVRLDAQKVPFLLNYAQCQLVLGNFYDVIEQCSQVLQRQPDNVKALYRRGVAHVKAWNPDKAEDDLKRAASLDASLASAVRAELNKLEQIRRQKNRTDSVWCRQAFGQS